MVLNGSKLPLSRLNKLIQWRRRLSMTITLLSCALFTQAKITTLDHDEIQKQQHSFLESKTLPPLPPSLSATQMVELKGKGQAKILENRAPKFSRRLLSAWEYVPLVSQAAEKWQIEPALIFAIIDAESAFNPKARSDKGAIGLMQIMPQGAALEVAQKYHDEHQVESERLYRPEVNIDIGSAYLHILNNVHLQAITSDTKRRLVVISAYNCGLSRVMQTLSRTNSLLMFSRNVNKMSEEALYFELTQKLPIPETRLYVAKVMHLYTFYLDAYP
ncbi:TPA: transglycosylase SLT domain-containing protein [Vibrio parahaemolyticus]|nr:transglycosylase SLT domain-containing protein [Vibrio parahaemolyticus]